MKLNLVEEHYKLGVTTTREYFKHTENKVEEHYKLGVTTTFVIKQTFSWRWRNITN